VLAALLLALVAAGRPGPAHADTESGLPEALRALMPPGIRPHRERTRLSEVRSAEVAYVAERVAPSGNGDENAVEVEYTVDPDLESRIRSALEAAGISLGHVIVIDPATGALLAYVSTRPEVFPATRAYPTASLMKVVTAAAVLRHAPRAARRDCRYVGSPHELRTDQLVEPAAGGVLVSFQRAIASSNNQCFARLAVHDVGEQALRAEIRGVGLLEAPGAGHPPGWIAPLSGDFVLGRLGSGVAGAFVSPLGAARLAAALARGELVEPRWIARARGADGEPLALPEPPAPRPVWPPRLADELRETLVSVTEGGTAAGAFLGASGERRLGPVRVSGKTGTVSGTDPAGRYQWFIGVAPAEAPTVAIAAVVLHERPGGTGAAEVAAGGLREIFCGEGPCEASRAERLQARARAREAEVARELAQRERERARAREQEEALRRAWQTAASHEVIELDQVPRPIRTSDFDFPPRLLRSPVRGTVVLLLQLSEQGRVMDVRVDSSDLPAFDEFVAREVKGWRFTPPTQGGVPVQARTRLPIPIRVN
jgi:TonB family protein